MTSEKRHRDLVDNLSAILDCPKRRIERVAVLLLDYCIKNHCMEYFHYYRKLKDNNY